MIDPPKPDTPPDAPSQSSVNILIVDDEPRNLAVLESVLGDETDYRLVRAVSADEALLALLGDEFALLILDVRMPGMTGLELARMIKGRRRNARVPIIFLTAHYGETQHLLDGYGSGAVDYLHKPVNAAILRSKVAVFAELHRANRELAVANRALLVEVGMRRQAEESLRALTHRVVQAQEAERVRVALELHDNIIQPLCALGFRSQALADRLTVHDGPAKEEALHVGELLGRTAGEVERITRNLRPSLLDHLGLAAVARAASKEFANGTGVAVKVDCVEWPDRLSGDIELAFYRILQEALKNVEKHASARHVTVQLTKTVDQVRLTITDDGDGFDPADHTAGQPGRGGLGLLGMRERATGVGATLTIKSTRGAGTVIEVWLALPPIEAVA